MKNNPLFIILIAVAAGGIIFGLILANLVSAQDNQPDKSSNSSAISGNGKFIVVSEKQTISHDDFSDKCPLAVAKPWEIWMRVYSGADENAAFASRVSLK